MKTRKCLENNISSMLYTTIWKHNHEEERDKRKTKITERVGSISRMLSVRVGHSTWQISCT